MTSAELAGKYGEDSDYLELKANGTFVEESSQGGGAGSMGSVIKGHWQLSVCWKIIHKS